MSRRKLWVYSPVISPRLEYTVSVIFDTILGVSYEITSDRRRIGGAPAVIYSGDNVRGGFTIPSSGLLAATGVSEGEPEVSSLGDMPLLFPCEGGTVPFDLFAASFYMLTRYEEYLTFEPDAHGRFPGEASLASRSGFLRLPVVDIWAGYLAGELVRHYPTLAFRSNEYRSLLTVDVDQPFAYRSRGLLRSMGGLVKGLAGVGAGATDRIRTISGAIEDPYDSFAYIEERLQGSDSDVLFFFPVGDQGEYDHNPPYRNRDYGETVRRYEGLYGSGLHPSYRSAARPKRLKMECERYRTITGHYPERARQHWLLLTMPDTYRHYEEAGIRYDYSMGYHDLPGFRAGIARPYPFYDLLHERVTTLTLAPFQVMEGTLGQYMELTPEEAIEVIRSLIAVTRSVGGQFVSIWHNTSLNEGAGWEGWRSVFEETIEMQKR